VKKARKTKTLQKTPKNSPVLSNSSFQFPDQSGVTSYKTPQHVLPTFNLPQYLQLGEILLN
jgi:hypothetical protein